MPTTSLSINGVPYTDTYKFLEEFKNVISRDADNIESILYDWAELEEAGTDEYESYLNWEAVRVPYWHDRHDRRCEVVTKRNAKFISKPKEVK